MKALTASLVLFASLNVSFAQKKINLDDPKVRDKITAEAIDHEKLEWRGEEGEELLYTPDPNTPYTGWSKKMHDNGQIEWLIQVKDGKRDGLATRWYSNGQKMGEGNFKNGKLWTAVGWKPNGERSETNVVKGNGVVIDYNDDGTEKRRDTFKDGVKVED